MDNIENEIPLTGGRVTKGVIKKGNIVYRPCCENSDFVHNALVWLVEKDPNISPHFIGIDKDGREMWTLLKGNSPDDIGEFTDIQLKEAGKIIKKIHNLMADFPGCINGQTVCHNDLSPCNFMFLDNMPYAVFDWDSAKIGDPMDDLAYSIWMWCDIGNNEQSIDIVIEKIKSIMKGYGIEYFDISNKIIEQMDRVGKSVIGTDREKIVRQWIKGCKEWVIMNKNCLSKKDI